MIGYKRAMKPIYEYHYLCQSMNNTIKNAVFSVIQVQTLQLALVQFTDRHHQFAVHLSDGSASR